MSTCTQGLLATLCGRAAVRSLLLATLMSVLAALAACAVPTQPMTPPNGSGAVDVERITTFVADEVRRHRIPGAALGLVEDDRILGLHGFGTADGTGRAVTAATPFLLASVSKPITATAVLQLVEAGTVSLDVAVHSYLNEFTMADPAAERITVRQLLQHTSGLPVTSCDTRRDASTLQEYVAELRTVRLAAEPGARHSYCSGNYNLLGRLVEVVTGQTFGTYLQEHVFTPLQMRQSFSAEGAAQQAGLAQGHSWLFGATIASNGTYNTSQLPSGYLISSAEDMTHFLIAQLNGGRYAGRQILSTASVAAMQAPGVPVGTAGNTYGLGWKHAALGGVPTIQHYGDNVSYHGVLFFDPTARRGAIILMNGNGVLPSTAAFRPIEEGVARLLTGQPVPESGLSLPAAYAIYDAVLLAALALILLPAVRLPRWARAQRQGRARRVRTRVRIAAELAVPVAVLTLARLALDTIGAQSWREGLSFLPDTLGWLWFTCLAVLATGLARLVIVLRTGRSGKGLSQP